MDPKPFLESRFRGLDLSQESHNLEEGFLEAADNLSLDGVDLITRPGLTALLSTAFSSAVRAFTPLAPISGTTERALLAADSGLYYWAGSTSASAVSGAGTVAHASAQIALIGGAGFLVDGSANLKRIRMESGVPTKCATLKELNRPDGTITLEPFKWHLMSDPTASAWSQWYLEGTTTAPGTSGAGTTIAPQNSIKEADKNFQGTFWNLSTGASVAGTMAHNADACATLDSSWGTSPEYITSDPVTLNAKRLAGNGANPAVGYARVAVVEYTVAAKTPPTNVPTEQVDLIATPYDASSSAISSGIITQRSPRVDTTNGAVVRALIDWRSLATEPRTFELKWQMPHIHATAGQGVDINHVNLLIPQQQIALSLDADDKITLKQGSVQVWGGAGSVASGGGQVGAVADPNSTPPGRLLTAGIQMSSPHVITKGDWLRAKNVAIEVFPGAGVQGLRLRVGAKESSTIYWSDPISVPDGGGWLDVQFGDQLNALTISTTVLYLEILDDVYIDGLQEGGNSIICRVGGMRNVGDLIQGLDYWYVISELDKYGDGTTDAAALDSTLQDVVVSDGSAPTKALTPTAGERMAKLTLPSAKNASASHLAVWRFGGSFLPEAGSPEVPTGRLLFLIPYSAPSLSWGEDYNKGGTSSDPIAFGNPYVQWDATNRILYDSTPDSWLSGADTYKFGREKAPTAPSSVAAWDSRLWVGKGSELYASWKIEPGRTKGIYWSSVNEPVEVDPDAPLKGWRASLTLPAGDSIVRIVPAGSDSSSNASGTLAPAMLVLTYRTVFVVMPSREPGKRYDVHELVGDDVRGVVGISAATVFEDWVWWMSDRGLLRWRPGMSRPERMGDRVRRALPGISPSMTYHANALPEVSLIAGVHYLYLCVPDASSDTAPNRLLVWHSREQGWTRWTTAACGGAGEILAGRDGQLRRITGSGDVTSVGGSASAVSVAFTTRRVGLGNILSSPGRLFYSLYLPGATNGSITFSVLGDGTTAASVTQSVLGQSDAWVRPSRSGSGRQHDISVSASTVERIRFSVVGLELIPRFQRR